VARGDVGHFLQMREVPGDGEVHQLLEQREVVARGEDFEVAEADEAGGHAAHDGAGFLLRVAVVEHVAHHGVAGGDHAEGTRGGHPQMMHGLAAQELTNARAQHGAPVGGARIGRGPGALELQLPALAARVHHFPQRDRAPVAQLAGPVAELMAAVAGGVGVHAGEQRVAAKHLGEGG